MLHYPHRRHHSQWERLLRNEESSSGLAAKFESWCIQCEAKQTVSDVSGGGNKILDLKPRRTIGNPAKYVERRPNCLTCKMGSRLIPIGESVPSIPMRQLRDFADKFGNHITDEELARRFKDAVQLRGIKGSLAIQSPRSVKQNTWNKADCVSVKMLHLAD